AASGDPQLRKLHQAQRAGGGRQACRFVVPRLRRHGVQPCYPGLLHYRRHFSELPARYAQGVILTMSKLVLFDFDGTLADTAPDLGAAVNVMRLRRGLPELPLEAYRSYASHGARGLLKAGLGMTPEDPAYEDARDEFLTEYEQG